MSPSGRGGAEHSCAASSPEQAFVEPVFPLGIVGAGIDVFHPAIRDWEADVVVQKSGAVGELRDHGVLRPWTHIMREELAVVEEVVWMVTWVHGFDVVVNEGFLFGSRRGTVEVDGLAPGERFGRAGFSPARGIDFGECGTGDVWCLLLLFYFFIFRNGDI